MNGTTKSSIRLSHFSSDLVAGAGRASLRLHDALRSIGLDSRIYSKQRKTRSFSRSSHLYYFRQAKAIESSYYLIEKFMTHNTYRENTLFSYPQLMNSFSTLDPIVQDSDIIQLHWVNRMLSLGDIAYLSQQNIPIVWTIHDKNIFTGGCHYTIGCEGWKDGCGTCPQLIHSLNQMPEKVFSAKKKYINFENITLVALNKEFKHLMEQSPLLPACKIHIIPNSIDTEYFNSEGRNTQRFKSTYGIPQDKTLIFYISSYGSKIKGFREFCETMRILSDREKYHIVLAGSIPEERNFSIPFTYLGYLQDEALIETYKNVDITALSSIEDNLPNICLESLACATPVFGFKVGGIPDLIQDGYNGYTVANGDCTALAMAIEKFTGDVHRARQMRQQSRDYALRYLKPEVQAIRYKRLYQDLLSDFKPQKPIRIPLQLEELNALKKIKDFKHKDYSLYLELVEWHLEKIQQRKHKKKSLAFYCYYFLFQSRWFQWVLALGKKILKTLLPQFIIKKLKAII